ncbi:MAG: cytochrome P450 [Actinobacteria bacterium]|nr:cytochrome P450 [Actinomycetota bacterium]
MSNDAYADELASPEFWTQPLRDRAARLAELREVAPFLHTYQPNPLTGESDWYWLSLRYADVIDISRRAKEFCSGQGSISVQDMPIDVMEFFGSFIVMDDPRHARQRGIVSRSFGPRQLQGLLDSVQDIADEVIDGFIESGEVDLVQAFSQPFPLLVICDMMGIPRSEFDTVLRNTNIILGAGDPDSMGEHPDFFTALMSAGVELTGLLGELADDRRKNPRDDLTTALVTAKPGEDVLTPEELAPFFILLAVAGNDTTRNAISYGMHFLSENPDQKAIWQNDFEAVTPTAIEEIVRMASPVTFMRRTAVTDAEVSGHQFTAGEKVVMLYGGANRDPREFENPEKFDVLRSPNNHVGFGGPGPHFCLGAHLARRELAVAFRSIFERMPDIEATAPAKPLNALGMPLVSGIKSLPVRFTPGKRLA